MIATKLESVAASFVMNRLSSVQNSFDKRIKLLTASGLIAGTIPKSMRQKSGQRILAFASSRQVGKNAE
jgi:hypothetical protein